MEDGKGLSHLSFNKGPPSTSPCSHSRLTQDVTYTKSMETGWKAPLRWRRMPEEEKHVGAPVRVRVVGRLGAPGSA